ncbi:MAG: hypothetical protein Ct9H300mP8_06150 [Gammaproteobacteria bacterium]|nr:MAG: hypothetical protein Ct9H300mP8_06150 [Gammaproteobacteria bacterium]
MDFPQGNDAQVVDSIAATQFAIDFKSRVAGAVSVHTLQRDAIGMAYRFFWGNRPRFCRAGWVVEQLEQKKIRIPHIFKGCVQFASQRSPPSW